MILFFKFGIFNRFNCAFYPQQSSHLEFSTVENICHYGQYFEKEYNLLAFEDILQWFLRPLA